MTFKQIQKLFLSLFLIISFGVYSFWRSRAAGVLPFPATASIPTKSNATPQPSSLVVPGPIDTLRRYLGDDGEEEDGVQIPKSQSVSVPIPAPVTTAPTSNPATIGTYKDGTYAGPASYAYTGTIQVTAIIRSGKIADIQVVDASQSRTSQQINANALPMLKTEAIQAQSANVNAVSGATYTTGAFIDSLTASLAKAKG